MPVFLKYLFYKKYFFCVIFGIVFALYISNMKTKSQNKGENKMEKAHREIRIVDFKTNLNAEKEIMEATKKCEAEFVDWYEKDYGIVAIYNVAYDRAAELETLIGNIHGATY